MLIFFFFRRRYLFLWIASLNFSFTCFAAQFLSCAQRVFKSLAAKTFWLDMKKLLVFFCSTSLIEQVDVRRATQISSSLGFCLVQFAKRTQNCFVQDLHVTTLFKLVTDGFVDFKFWILDLSFDVILLVLLNYYLLCSQWAILNLHLFFSDLK